MTIGFKLERVKVGNDVWGWRQLGHTVVTNQRPNSQIGRTEFYLACSCGGEHTLSRDPRIDHHQEESLAVHDHFDHVRNQRLEELEERHSAITFRSGGELLA